MFAFVLCEFSSHGTICRVSIECFEHLNRRAHIASQRILGDAFVQTESRLGVVASRTAEDRSNAGWSCRSTA